MLDPVFDIFREEAKEHLSALEKGFLDLETPVAAETRQARIHELFRHAHSLKGDARAVGLAEMQEAAQQLEDILDGLRENPDSITPAVIDRGLLQFDAVRKAFETWRQHRPAEPSPPLEEPPQGTEPVRVQAPLPGPPAAAEDSFSVRVSSERLDRLLSLAGDLRIAQRAGEQLISPLQEVRGFLGTVAANTRRLQQQLGRLCVPGRGELPRKETPAAAVPDSLPSQVHELYQQLSDALDQLHRVDGELRKQRVRERVLLDALESDIQQTRLLPLALLTDSLRRVVRDLAQSLNKTLRLEADVGDVLLDKAVIEALREPLLHLLRNAADHGIEAPDERLAVGKPAEGLIQIQAVQRRNRVRILVRDDGRGVHYERIRQRLRREEHPEAEVAEMSEAELGQYLFQPGFTTRTAATALSGRGVGLDVVAHTLHSLHGRVELLSSSAAGTAFALTVPVSISTVRIVTVVCGDQYFGIPTALVERIGRLRTQELHDLGGQLMLLIEEEPVRWLPLDVLLKLPPSRPPRDADPWPYVLIHQDRRRLVLAVDDLGDEAEVLLKPLAFPLTRVPGIMGGTIRPDGSLQLVLDLAGLAFPKSVPQLTAAPEPKRAARLLVVDDSPTTRAILRNVFRAAGYQVRTATDGMDALEQLRFQPVDLVVSDIEMPRLDGMELTRRIKTRYGLPVILVTGLEKEEQRRKGLEAGADAYVVKSTFQGAGLLEIVQQFV